MIIKLSKGSFLKGGVLSTKLKDIEIPNWMTKKMLRVIDRLVFLAPLMREMDDGEKLFRYVIKASGNIEFPVISSGFSINPLSRLYQIVAEAMQADEPHKYFTDRVSLEEDIVLISDAEPE